MVDRGRRWGIVVAASLALAVLAGPSALAQGVVPQSEAPGRERERFRERAPPRAEPRGAIELRATMPPEEAEGVRLTVTRIVVEGSTVYSPEDLAPLYADILGREVSLKAVYDVAQAITAKYGADGYVLSRVIVPPQRFSRRGATIRLRAVEGYVDRVVWPDTLAKYRDVFTPWGAKITADRPANIRSLERYLLLGNDLPGLKLRTTLKPSDANTGAATLIVEADEKPVDVVARIDNRGTEARGPWQYLAGVTFNNLLRQHEQISISYAGTFQTSELQYVGGTFRYLLNPEGLAFTTSAAYSTGKPGTDTLRRLGFETKSLTWEAGLLYPVKRSRDENLTLSALVFATDARGDMLATVNSNDRLRGARFRLDYDVADRFNGINQFQATLSAGVDGLGSTDSRNPFPSRAGGRVDFVKFDASYGRLQPLGNGFSLYTAVEGQVTGMTLLAPEECGYGGRTMGRAFDPSELTGDRCLMGSVELRYDVPVEGGFFSRTQLYGFLDRGTTWRENPSASTRKTQSGTSAGAGVRLTWKENLFADLTLAKPLDGRADDGWRAFVTVTGRY